MREHGVEEEVRRAEHVGVPEAALVDPLLAADLTQGILGKVVEARALRGRSSRASDAARMPPEAGPANRASLLILALHSLPLYCFCGPKILGLPALRHLAGLKVSRDLEV